MPDTSETSNPPKQGWSGRSIGGVLLFRFGVTILPIIGLRGAWFLSGIASPIILLFGSRHAFGLRQYWRRLRPKSVGFTRWLLIYRHMSSFVRITSDRLLAFLRPQNYTVTPLGIDGMRSIRQQGKGCILISAHVGNWEMSSYWLHSIAGNMGKTHIVMVRADIEYAQRFCDERLRGQFTNVIDPRDGIGASLAINNALKDGDMVCMLADRVFGDQPAVTVKFMGGDVRMPTGPFQAAAVTGAPILVGFLVKTGFSSYLVQVDEPWYIRLPNRRADRGAALQNVVQRWAKRLELQVRRYPMQWHNFYNYWDK